MKTKKEIRQQIAGTIQFAMYCKRNNADLDFEKLSYEKADQILKLFSQQKKEIAEDVENMRAKAHNGKDVYNDLIKLQKKL